MKLLVGRYWSAMFKCSLPTVISECGNFTHFCSFNSEDDAQLVCEDWNSGAKEHPVSKTIEKAMKVKESDDAMSKNWNGQCQNELK